LNETRPTIKVLLAKLGLDGHDRGVKVVAKALEAAGMEVVYMGMRVTPEDVAQRAEAESVNVVGVSLLSGAHNRLMDKLVRAVEAHEMRRDTIILVGGTIPDRDVERLHEIGVDGVFPVGSSLADIEEFIRKNAKPAENPAS
jgi:methylmalonyl-CoA mutase C-terminal domain/subunit